MLNDIIAISIPRGTLSGAGRNQALKDGSFPGLCPSTDDPEPEQINFLTMLSRLGVGTVQVTPDESNNANPKLAEEKSPDGAKAEDAVSEKSKRKQGKSDRGVKQLTTTSTDTLGIVIGLQSLQDQPQSALSADPSFHAPGSENEKEVDAGSAAQTRIASTVQVKEKAEMLTVSKVDFSGTGRIQAASMEGTARETEQRPEQASIPGPVSSDAGQAQAAGVQAPQTLQGGVQSVAETISSDLEKVPKAEQTHTGRIQAAPMEGSAKEMEQRPEQASIPGPVSSNAGQAQTAGVQVPRTFQVRQQTDAAIVPESELAIRADYSVTDGHAQAAPMEGSAKEMKQRPEQASSPWPVSSNAGQAQTAGDLTPQSFQDRQQPDAATVPESELAMRGDYSVMDVRVQAAPMEGSAKEMEQRPEQKTAQEPVSSNAGQVQAVSVQAPQTLQGGMQSAAETVSESEMVPKADPLRTDRAQADQVQTDQVEGTPKLRRLQKRDSISIPDTVNLNLAAVKNSSGVKAEQTEKLSPDKSMNAAAAREKAPADPKDDPGIRRQAGKGKTASFLSAKDSAQTGAVAAPSAGASNAQDNKTPNMFMAANPSGKIAEVEDDASFKPLEPESGNMAVNFSREAQMEKASLVNPSQKESLPEGQSFHAEVLKQVVEKTSSNLKSGLSEIRIDLKPESLGHLRLFVSSEHQQVTVKILAENPQVKDMIENQVALIKNELQLQGIHVNTVKVDMLMSGGSDFAYSQHEGTAFKQARHESAYGGGKGHIADSAPKEPDSLDQISHKGGSIVNYFA